MPSLSGSTRHTLAPPGLRSITGTLSQPSRVEGEVALGVITVKANGIGDGRIDPEAATLDIFGRDKGVGPGMVSILVYEPDGVKDLHGVVGVQTRHHLGD